MWIALILGLTGSFGHCAGMCSGIVLLVQRTLGTAASPRSWAWIHTGRLIAYAFFGFAAGLLGKGMQAVFSGFGWIQGLLGLYAALIGFYFVFVLLGRVPGPELLLPSLAVRWRKLFLRLGPTIDGPRLLLVGLVWGLLPCGLVLTALFTAAIAASPLAGAGTMLAFGAGTLPVLISIRWLSGKVRSLRWPRYGAALALAFFSLQIGLRSVAAVGLVDHLMVGKVMLW